MTCSPNNFIGEHLLLLLPRSRAYDSIRTYSTLHIAYDDEKFIAGYGQIL